MDKEELLERYEATGEEASFLQARALYEKALEQGQDPHLLQQFGYLLESVTAVTRSVARSSCTSARSSSTRASTSFTTS